MFTKLRLINWVSAGLLTVMCSGASAQENNMATSKLIEVKQSLGLIRNIYLVVDDQVSGGCWTNISRIKQKTRLTLEQSGISVYDEPLLTFSPFSINLIIIGHGMRTENGTCFGSINISTLREIFQDFRNKSIKYLVSNFSRSSIAISSDNLNDQFLSSTETFISQFSADVIAGRRNTYVGEILSGAKDTKPVTKKQFIEMLRQTRDGGKGN